MRQPKISLLIRRLGFPCLCLRIKKDSDQREFYSLSKNKINMTSSLPEAKGKRCMEAGFGWVLTVSSSGELNLLKPLTRSQIQLPSCTTFPDNQDTDFSDFLFIQRVALSANPSHASSFVLMVIHEWGQFLGFWRPGDLTWTSIEPGIHHFGDVRFYNGIFYAVDRHGDVWAWDESSSKLKCVFGTNPRSFINRDAYLVESSSGKLLTITRDGVLLNEEDDQSYGVNNFKVIQLDVTKCEWEEITCLGNDAIFVGHSSAVAIVASAFPDVIKSNCIYFTDDCWEAYTYREMLGRGGGRLGLGGGEDMGIYHLEDGSIERFSNIESVSFISPPVWISF
ncbi:OLC1v1029702C1 [Oldenlandia corymbosa var. corymbosa]|uniref:OLC1v1029702C1 n=1 Tax=Oldenlandia corymbosa var. corymbosa TaxID=529605 RepID=A0AAV1CF17_OLDCO|nr:OLC1v1029702C1 [Oldenlandia corymbosa var. corymbosa]